MSTVVPVATAGERRPIGLVALVLFFGAGMCIAGLSAVSLSMPGSWLEPMWRLNPDARDGFRTLGGLWSVLLMVTVSASCGIAAIGLWRLKRWGWQVAIALLSINLLGDLANAVVRDDWRTLIGMPIGGAMLLYLTRPRLRELMR